MMQTVILDYCLSNHNNSLTAELCSQQIKKILKQLLNLSTADQYQDLLPFIKFVLDSIYLDQDAQKSDKTSLARRSLCDSRFNSCNETSGWAVTQPIT